MNSVESHAADEASRRTDEQRYADLGEDLAALDAVFSVHVHTDRLPPRVEVVLDRANVTPAVQDRIDAYDAEIVPDSVEVTGRGTLRFDLVTPELFKPAGSRETREYGSHSTAWTFTHASVELSGFDEDTMLDAYARDGAVLLVRRD